MTQVEYFNWSVGHRSRRRSLWQQPVVRPPEGELSVGVSLHPVALFVDRTVVSATEHREIRESRGTAIGPVADVMPLAERAATPGESTAVVAMLQYPT